MKLDEVLKQVLERSEVQFKKQIEYILKELYAEAPEDHSSDNEGNEVGCHNYLNGTIVRDAEFSCFFFLELQADEDIGDGDEEDEEAADEEGGGEESVVKGDADEEGEHLLCALFGVKDDAGELIRKSIELEEEQGRNPFTSRPITPGRGYEVL